MSYDKNTIKGINNITRKPKSSLSVKKVDGITKKIVKKYTNQIQKELVFLNEEKEVEKNKPPVDDKKRLFLKMAGVAGIGMVASAVLPNKAEAYIAGSTPTSNVVGLKDDANNRINPATEETVSSLLSGQGVVKLTTSLSGSGNIITPTSGKRIRVYAARFSLTADASSVSFRFTSDGADYEKYLSPKTGGLYGSNNHPNFVEGGVNEALYCVISGTTTVQINIDYLEV